MKLCDDHLNYEPYYTACPMCESFKISSLQTKLNVLTKLKEEVDENRIKAIVNHIVSLRKMEVVVEERDMLLAYISGLESKSVIKRLLTVLRTRHHQCR